MQAIVEWPTLRYFSCVLQGMDSLRHRWKLTSDSSPIAKQHQKPCSGPPPVYQDLSNRHYWPVQNAVVNFPIRLKGNLKHISGNLLSLLGAQNKYIGSASQALLTGVSLRCGIGTDFLLLPPYPGLSKVSGCQRKSPPTWLVLVGYSGWHFFTYSVFQKKYPWASCFLRHVSRLFQTFLTTLYIRQSQ